MSLDHIRRGLDRAVARQKKASLSTTSPAVKAPVVAPKEEEPALKSNLTEEEVQYYCDLINEANARSPSHPNNPTNRIIRERLEALGLKPDIAE
ncbi:hypothetical protein [Stutzerimonas nitrititolerans]|uniref:hypothetical protein n=1 Tax=Stutzerimonas nitrititolerans TaxID=2482751 RepID=UPI0028A5C992|nr:hypothetical protein [Stutzerimonas nitrititolerans]